MDDLAQKRPPRQRSAALESLVVCCLLFFAAFLPSVLGLSTSSAMFSLAILVLFLLPLLWLISRDRLYVSRLIFTALVSLGTFALFARLIGDLLAQPGIVRHVVFIASVAVGVIVAHLCSYGKRV
jgi:hypothetical protein